MTNENSPDDTLARESQAPRLTPAQRRITFISVMIVFFLTALSQTIMSTALPRIVSDLDGLELYSWVMTIYLLTSTIMVPIWGKLGDLFGHKIIILWGAGIFVVGSALCGLSGEFGPLPLLGDGMMQLIIFRGIQGIGGGALFTAVFATIADIFPARERAQFAGLVGAVFGVATVLGPLVGGFFTDHGSFTIGGFHVAGWRWVFYVNLPASLIALVLLAYKMPNLGERQGGKIDYTGALLVMIGIGALLLALTWGGNRYAWTSPELIMLLMVAVISILAFIWVEARIDEPILPLDLFRIRAFSTCVIASVIMSVAFMGTLIFLPLFLQIGLGVGATVSGLSTLPLMLGLVASSAVVGRLVSTTGLYKPYMIGGGILVGLGLFLMAQLDASASLFQVNWRLALVGIGLGPSQSLFNIIAQNAAPAHQLGVATSSIQFFRQIGSTIGVAVFGTLLTLNLATGLAKQFPGADTLSVSDLQALAMQDNGATNAAPLQLPPEVQDVFVSAMTSLFDVGLLVAILGLIAILFIPHVKLEDHSPDEPEALEDDQNAAEVRQDLSEETSTAVAEKLTLETEPQPRKTTVS